MDVLEKNLKQMFRQGKKSFSANVTSVYPDPIHYYDKAIIKRYRDLFSSPPAKMVIPCRNCLEQHKNVDDNGRPQKCAKFLCTNTYDLFKSSEEHLQKHPNCQKQKVAPHYCHISPPLNTVSPPLQHHPVLLLN